VGGILPLQPSSRLVALTATGAVIWNLRDAPLAADNGTAVPAGQMRPTVAVLGFRNLAGRTDTDWLSAALAEMLSAELATGTELRAIPGETIYRMKADLELADADSYGGETLARIRENLGSDLVVSGSYVTVGGGDETELRVDIRLQDARAGETVAVITETGRSGGAVRARNARRWPTTPTHRRRFESRGRCIGSGFAAGIAGGRASVYRRSHTLAASRCSWRARAAGAGRRSEPEFALAHSALAASWAALGYDNRAREAAERALALSADLPRAERLEVEAVSREMARQWTEAVTIWETLAAFFPDDVEHALRLANAQVTSGAAARRACDDRQLPSALSGVQGSALDLAEARAADTLSDFARVRTAAAGGRDARRCPGRARARRRRPRARGRLADAARPR
jgi:TolB-like protein